MIRGGRNGSLSVAFPTWCSPSLGQFNSLLIEASINHIQKGAIEGAITWAETLWPHARFAAAGLLTQPVARLKGFAVLLRSVVIRQNCSIFGQSAQLSLGLMSLNGHCLCPNGPLMRMRITALRQCRTPGRSLSFCLKDDDCCNFKYAKLSAMSLFLSPFWTN